MQVPETVKVQREACEENPTGIVIINKEDFDAAVDTLVDEGGSLEAGPAEPAAAPVASVATEPAAAAEPVVEPAAEVKPWEKK